MVEGRLDPAPLEESADEPNEAFLREFLVPTGDDCTLGESFDSHDLSIEQSGDAGRASVASPGAVIRTCLLSVPALAEPAAAMLDARRPTPRVTPRVTDRTRLVSMNEQRVDDSRMALQSARLLRTRATAPF